MNVKQDLNIYTVMLLTAFVALLIGCIALAIEMGRYPSPTPWRSGSQRVSAMLDFDKSPSPPHRQFNHSV
jgi:hypothetical protein